MSSNDISQSRKQNVSRTRRADRAREILANEIMAQKRVKIDKNIITNTTIGSKDCPYIFSSEDGDMPPISISGITVKQFKKLEYLVLHKKLKVFSREERLENNEPIPDIPSNDISTDTTVNPEDIHDQHEPAPSSIAGLEKLQELVTLLKDPEILAAVQRIDEWKDLKRENEEQRKEIKQLKRNIKNLSEMLAIQNS